MKKLFLTLSVAVFFISCEKKTHTTIEEDGDQTTVETVGFDEERIDSTAEKVEDGLKDAAQKTGEALEKAGDKLQRGADDAEEDIREATDGDGDPKK